MSNSNLENNRNKNFVDEVKDHLLCPICFEIFKKPVLMVCCGQTLCEECVLISMMQQTTIGGGSQRRNCPMCRSCDDMSYVKNIVVEDIVQSMQSRCINNSNNNTKKETTTTTQFSGDDYDVDFHWKTATDPTSGRMYYYRLYHELTEETTWEKPRGYKENTKKETTTTTQFSGDDDDVDFHWKTATDPFTGRAYYYRLYHKLTEETTWEKPRGY